MLVDKCFLILTAILILKWGIHLPKQLGQTAILSEILHPERVFHYF